MELVSCYTTAAWNFVVVSRRSENLWARGHDGRYVYVDMVTCNFRFSVPCIFYRSQIKVPNRCN
jgi:hypothetical protein